jgi:hypothetical protein
MQTGCCWDSFEDVASWEQFGAISFCWFVMVITWFAALGCQKYTADE